MKKWAYYNDIDAKVCAWVRELIKHGLVTDGEVDNRPIQDVRPEDVRGFQRAHFFCGIAVWDYALRLAGWADDRPVWTGSCPCQPFSAAGKRKAHDDERHLWPAWFALVRECRPVTILGEQVGGKIGKAWFDHVRADVETCGYAAGLASFGACDVGAPHIRQRLYFVADAGSRSGEWHAGDVLGEETSSQREGFVVRRESDGHCDGRTVNALADAEHAERRSERRSVEDERDRNDGGREETHGIAGACGEIRAVADAEANGFGQGRSDDARRGEGIRAEGAGERFTDDSGSGIVGDAERAGSQGLVRSGDMELHGGAGSVRPASEAGAVNGFWRNAVWLPCRDGKARPVEPGTFPLVDGTPARVVRLRGYGNCIVAPQAETFIRAYLDLIGD